MQTLYNIIFTMSLFLRKFFHIEKIRFVLYNSEKGGDADG